MQGKVNREKPVFRDRSGKKWFNSSVLELMRVEEQDGETPVDVIRRIARLKVIDARNLGWTGPPFDPEMLADLSGIKVETVSHDIGAEAHILSLPDRRLLIQCSINMPETRRRFSICHEIAHTFFPDYFENVRQRNPEAPFDPVHAELERLCHIGAGELLMPLQEFKTACIAKPPSFAAADTLGKLFNASQEAALRRMVDLSDKPCCILWLSNRLKPAEARNATPELGLGLEPIPAKLRVDYMIGSPLWTTFLPPHKSIPQNSLAYSVLAGEAYEQAVEDWSTLQCGTVRLECIGSLHNRQDVPGVMVLLQGVP